MNSGKGCDDITDACLRTPLIRQQGISPRVLRFNQHFLSDLCARYDLGGFDGNGSPPAIAGMGGCEVAFVGFLVWVFVFTELGAST